VNSRQPAAPHPAGEKRANGLAWRTRPFNLPGSRHDLDSPSAKVDCKHNIAQPAAVLPLRGRHLFGAHNKPPLDVFDYFLLAGAIVILVCC
jgi:hypothetical protein